MQRKLKTYLPALDNRNNNLTPTPPITRNMSRERLHICYQLRLCFFRRSPTYTAPEIDGLACYLALERTEQELRRICWGSEVETCPVDGGGGRGQRVVGVPEEGCCVGEVAVCLKVLVRNGYLSQVWKG